MADGESKPDGTPELVDGWRVVGQSVIGAAHIRAGMPNQDAIGWLPENATALPLTLVVSDGHGGSRNFRSDVGSKFAIQIALEVMQDFAAGCAGENLSSIKRTAEERLPQQLARRWDEEVRKHLATQAFSDADIKLLLKKDEIPAPLPADFNPLIAYGATLLIARVEKEFILYLQLGDGDMVAVAADGTAARPLPSDERLFANETTSLCSLTAWRDFRVRFQAISDSHPALIVLSTDGYANSFRDDAGFLQVGPDIVGLIRSDGLEKVNASMKEWLTEASQSGSGDDITVGCVCNMKSLLSAPKAADDGQQNGGGGEVAKEG